MPPKHPKKGKGKKVTVTDPTSAPAPAPAAPPNPEVQAVLDAHIANVGSEHFPGGYFPIPYTLTSPDAESFPQPPPLPSWRAPTSQLARAKSGLGAPTCDLARQLVNLREPRPGKPTLGLLYRVGVFSAREGHETRGFLG